MNYPINARSDTWNVGKIMFELMEQEEIHADRSLYEYKWSDRYKASKQYSKRLEDLVLNCLKHDPNQRPSISHLL